MAGNPPPPRPPYVPVQYGNYTYHIYNYDDPSTFASYVPVEPPNPYPNPHHDPFLNNPSPQDNPNPGYNPYTGQQNTSTVFDHRMQGMTNNLGPWVAPHAQNQVDPNQYLADLDAHDAARRQANAQANAQWLDANLDPHLQRDEPSASTSGKKGKKKNKGWFK